MSSVSCSSSCSPCIACKGSSRPEAMFTAAGTRSEEAFFHGDDVAGKHDCVLVDALAGLGLVVLPDDEDLVLRGAFLEAAGQRYRLDHREARDVLVASGLLHLAVDEEIAVFDDRHRDLRVH